MSNINREYYITDFKSSLEKFKSDWNAAKKELDTISSKFTALHKFIYFLHKDKGWKKAEIARLLNVSDPRVGQIIQQVKKTIKEGGVVNA